MHANVPSLKRTILPRSTIFAAAFVSTRAIEECPFVGSSFTAMRQSRCFPLGLRLQLRSKMSREADTFHRLLQYDDIRAQPSSRRSLHVRNPQLSHIEPTRSSGSSFEDEGVGWQARSLTMQPGTAFLLAKLAIRHCTDHPSHERISAPLPMALRSWAARPSEGTGDVLHFSKIAFVSPPRHLASTRRHRCVLPASYGELVARWNRSRPSFVRSAAKLRAVLKARMPSSVIANGRSDRSEHLRSLSAPLRRPHGEGLATFSTNHS